MDAKTKVRENRLRRMASRQGLRWLLGHRDSVITLKTYTHFVEDKKNDVQELASNISGGGQ